MTTIPKAGGGEEHDTHKHTNIWNLTEKLTINTKEQGKKKNSY